MMTMLQTEQDERKDVRIVVGNVILKGHLVIPHDADSMIIFSYGSGRRSFCQSHNFVAAELNKKKMATLLIDLLTPAEGFSYENRFNIDVLKERLVKVTAWVRSLPGLERFSIGYFGTGTGAASALRAAAELKDEIAAVVLRSGRPDLAEPDLYKVESPVLLLVGSLDSDLIQLNHLAFERLHSEKKLEFVEDATHLFEEPGKLEEAMKQTTEWFEKYLVNNKLIHA